jgi:thiamine monophosphate synthase
LGLAALTRASEQAQAAGVPLVAIGGLTLNLAPELAKLPLLAAVISDLLAEGDAVAPIAARALAWQTALG